MKWITLGDGIAATLWLSGAAKLVWLFAGGIDVGHPDLIFAFVSTGHLLLIAAAAELTVAWLLLSAKNGALGVLCTAWLSSLLLLYRIGLHLVGYQGQCHCLGQMPDFLHLPPAVEGPLIWLVLGYLFFGSLYLLSRERSHPDAVDSVWVLHEAANSGRKSRFAHDANAAIDEIREGPRG